MRTFLAALVCLCLYPAAALDHLSEIDPRITAFLGRRPKSGWGASLGLWD